MLHWNVLFMKHIWHSSVYSKIADRACSVHHALLLTLVISWNPLLQHTDHHGLWLAVTCSTIPGVILVENHPSCWTHKVNKTNMVFSSWKVQACTSNRRGLSDPFSYFNPFFFISLLKARRHWEKFRLLVLALKAHVEGSPSFGVESLSKVQIFGFLKYVSASNPFWFFTGKMFSEMLY